MQNVKSTGISFPKNIIDKIDSERGDISRSRYVCRILEKEYYTSEEDKKIKTDMLLTEKTSWNISNNIK